MKSVRCWFPVWIFLTVLVGSSAVPAQPPVHRPPVPPPGGQQGPGPEIIFGLLQGMMEQFAPATMLVHEKSLLVLKGNMLYRLSLETFKVLDVTILPGEDVARDRGLVRDAPPPGQRGMIQQFLELMEQARRQQQQKPPPIRKPGPNQEGRVEPKK